MNLLTFVSYVKSGNSVNKRYFIKGDTAGLKEFIFLRKDVVCLLVESLFSLSNPSLASHAELGHVLHTFCACHSHLSVPTASGSSAAVTKSPRLWGLSSRHLLLTVPEAGSLRSRPRQIRCVVRACFLAYRRLRSCCVFTW